MADDGEAFVSRWSRRKRDARIEEEAKPSVPVTPAPEITIICVMIRQRSRTGSAGKPG